MGDLGVVRKMKCNWKLVKSVVIVWTAFTGLRIETRGELL
jgi:hypothetical protein